MSRPARRHTSRPFAGGADRQPRPPAAPVAADRRRRAAEKRAERQVAAFFGLSMVCTVLFVVAYFTFEIGDNFDTFLGLGASNVALGVTLGGALLFIGIGIIQWARKLMGDHEIVEMRHPAASSEEDRDGHARGPRRWAPRSPASAAVRWCATRLLGAVGLLGLPAVVLLRDLGPAAGATSSSQHRSGRRACASCATSSARPIKASDLEIGDLVNAAPEALFPDRGERLPRDRGRRAPGPEGQGARSSSSGWSPATSSRRRAARTGPSTASSATPRSAPTSAARSR